LLVPGAIPPILSFKLTSILLNKLFAAVTTGFAETFLFAGPVGVGLMAFFGPVGVGLFVGL
jgi:hypothetical protein